MMTFGKLVEKHHLTQSEIDLVMTYLCALRLMSARKLLDGLLWLK